MPVQDYNINTRDAVVGQLYGMQQTRADIQTGMASAEIEFGQALQNDPLSPRGVKPGMDPLTGKILGVALRQISREAKTRPSDGTVAYKVGEAIPVLQDGRVMIEVADAGQISVGQFPYVDNNTGKFYIATSTGRTLAGNVTFCTNQTVVAGDVVAVNVTNALQQV